MKFIHCITVLITGVIVSCGGNSADTQDKTPVQYRLRQIIMEPEISQQREREVYERAVDALERARSGEDFGMLARTLSEEPNAANTAGDLGYFKFGDMVKSFSQQVFSMKPGEIAGPVKTQFGFHVIKLLDIKDDTRHAQHILFMLTPGREDSLAVLEQLADIRERILDGANFGDMVERHVTNELVRETSGYMVWQTTDMMLDSFRTAVDGLSRGDITEPFTSIIGMHIVKVDSINYNPDITFEGFPPEIEESLQQQ